MTYPEGLAGLGAGGHWKDASGALTTDWTQNDSSDPKTIEQLTWTQKISSLLPFINKLVGMDGTTITDFSPSNPSEKAKYDQRAWVFFAGPNGVAQTAWAGVAPATGAIKLTGGTTDPTGKVIPLDAKVTPTGVEVAKGSVVPPPIAPPVSVPGPSNAAEQPATAPPPAAMTTPPADGTTVSDGTPLQEGPVDSFASASLGKISMWGWLAAAAVAGYLIMRRKGG